MDASAINMMVLGTSIGFLFLKSSGSVTLFGFLGLMHKSCQEETLWRKSTLILMTI